MVTPGVTIRDRLGGLHPERDDNHYRERDLVAAYPWGPLLAAQLEIVDSNVFLPPTVKELQGFAPNSRKQLRCGRW